MDDLSFCMNNPGKQMEAFLIINISRYLRLDRPS